MSRRIRSIRFSNRFGLHMRPATEVVRIASSYEAEPHISVAGKRASARSILDLLILGVQCGDLVEVSAIGRDADDALDALCAFLDSYRDCEKLPDPDPKVRGSGYLDSSAA